LYKSEIPYSSESETLFVFTVITRSQNIGRPLLKRFPSCAIVCLCTITAATFTVSVRQTHWEYFLYEFSSISMSRYVIHIHNKHTRTHTHTHLYTKFHPYPATSTLWNYMTFSASCHSQARVILSTFCTYTHLLTRERCFENVYRPGIRHGSSKLSKGLFKYLLLSFFNTFHTQRSLLFPWSIYFFCHHREKTRNILNFFNVVGLSCLYAHRTIFFSPDTISHTQTQHLSRYLCIILYSLM